MKRFLAIVALSGVTLCLTPMAYAQNGKVNGTSVDVSGTITSGGTYQTAVAANPYRANCTIQNPADATEDLNVKIGTMAEPYVLAAGQALSTLNGSVNATDAITVTATTTGHAYAGTCQ
ncbi:MAG TPA: hypothetical protein VG892_07595 [Terriglobales bacterium]|nr:hypothetical protein [Terriglobales bacterium]